MTHATPLTRTQARFHLLRRLNPLYQCPLYQRWRWGLTLMAGCCLMMPTAAQALTEVDTVRLEQSDSLPTQAVNHASASPLTLAQIPNQAFEYNPLEPLSTPEPLADYVVNRDRVNKLLESNNVCEAALTLDLKHTQELLHHFNRLSVEDAVPCDMLRDRLAEDAALIYVFTQNDKTHLISLTAHGHANYEVSSVDKAALVAEISQFQRQLTHPNLRRSDYFLPRSQQLYDWIVEPLIDELTDQNISTLLFNLDQELRTIPLAALHDGKQFLVENYQIALIPSSTLTPTGRSDLQDASVLALGISEFEQLATLPAVPVEINSIREQFPNTTSFAEDQATLQNFQAQLDANPQPIIHLATHGNFKPGQVDNSYLQFWDQQLSLKQVEEIDWSNSAVELLVLSACKTALGDPTVEYGFAGLAVQAQVGAAIAGLWSANDAATLALMSELYYQLSLGVPKGEALRQAQLALLNGTVRLENEKLVGPSKNTPLPTELQALGDRTFWHPYYWSGFTLIGNPW